MTDKSYFCFFLFVLAVTWTQERQILKSLCMCVCFCVFCLEMYALCFYSAFAKVGWYEGLVDRYMSAIPSVTVANTSCHLPRSDAFNLFRDPISGDLPWPGLVFGLTVLATWVWCMDQVTSHASDVHTFCVQVCAVMTDKRK